MKRLWMLAVALVVGCGAADANDPVDFTPSQDAGVGVAAVQATGGASTVAGTGGASTVAGTGGASAVAGTGGASAVAGTGGASTVAGTDPGSCWTGGWRWVDFYESYTAPANAKLVARNCTQDGCGRYAVLAMQAKLNDGVPMWAVCE